MNQLGNGLSAADHHEDSLSVEEANLAMMRRLGASEISMLVVQGNLASTYRILGRSKESMLLRRAVYSGCARVYGEEHEETLIEAGNLANLLEQLERFEEAKALLRKTTPVARRVLGEGCDTTLRMRRSHARTLYKDANATLDNLCEAVTTLEEITRNARRVLGGAHPLTVAIEDELQNARAALRARETPSPGSA